MQRAYATVCENTSEIVVVTCNLDAARDAALQFTRTFCTNEKLDLPLDPGTPESPAAEPHEDFVGIFSLWKDGNRLVTYRRYKKPDGYFMTGEFRTKPVLTLVISETVFDTESHPLFAHQESDEESDYYEEDDE